MARLDRLGIRTFRASGLLRARDRPITGLKMLDALKNQEILISVLRDIAASERRVVLDCHFLLRTIEGPFLVPDALAKTVGPCGFVFIEGSIASLISKTRTGLPAVSRNEARDLRHLEEIHVRRLARALAVRFHKIRAQDTAALQRALTRMFER